jgi:hypothetical protein
MRKGKGKKVGFEESVNEEGEGKEGWIRGKFE